VLPNLGLETLHHVHADDLALWIIAALQNRAASVGEVFNAVSAQAVTLRGYAEAAYGWFGQEPRLEFQPVREWLAEMDADLAESAWGHVRRSSCHSIEKSRSRLGYAPRYSSLEAIRQSVMALVADGRVSAD
jgi:nucleoside-diphosphate-sugar epimerase